MKALVLSAGYGERLRPLTATVPKPLLQIGGRPLIHYALLMLKAAGVTDIAINVHYLAEQIEHSLKDGSQLGLSITYSPELTLMGTGGPLLALRDYFADQPFIIANCDTIIDLDISHLITFHRKQNVLATLVLRDSGDPDTYSRIEIDTDARIRRMRLLKGRSRGEFLDYPASLDPDIAALLNPYMYCGVMLCEPEILRILPPTAPFSLISDVLAPNVADGLAGYVHRGFFRTVDDRASYEALRAEFAQSAPPLRFC